MRFVQRLRRAASAFSGGDLATAEAECRSILAAAPQNADAMHLLALVLRRAGHPGHAEDLLRSSIALAPERAEFRINLGNLFRATGRIRDAELQYRTALDLEPNSRTARLALARTLNDAGAHTASEREVRRLLQDGEPDAEAWMTLGLALRAQNRYAEAESAYRQALSIRPDYAVARHNLGALLGHLKRAEESLEQLDGAAALGISGPELHFNRGRALIELGRFAEAETALVSAIRLAPRDPQAQVLLAKLRFMLGDESFARDLAEASRLHPALRGLLADLYRRAERRDEAESLLRSIIDGGQATAGDAASLAVVLQEQGRHAEALDHARAACAACPDDSDMAETLSTLYLQMGRVPEAQALIGEQRARHPLDQRWLAHEATAARLVGDSRYEVLYDYGRFVRAFELQPPAGYATIREFNADLIARLEILHRQGFTKHPLDQSLRGGTQTSRSMLADPDPRIRSFLEALEAPLADYRRAIGHDSSHPLLARNDGPLRIVGCWSVRLRMGGFHVNHVHPEGWISSAYYVQVPEEVLDLENMSGWIKFGEASPPVPGIGPEHFVQPVAGRLVLFPSYMWHGTTPINSDQPRMTIAFDAIPMPRGA